MERLYMVADICTRYQCKAATARRIMREMVHMEKPLAVTERAITEWERRRTYPPERVTRELTRKGAKL